MKDNLTERREFLQTAGAVGAFTILSPRLVRGSEANSAVRVGLLDAGGAAWARMPTPSPSTPLRA